MPEAATTPTRQQLQFQAVRAAPHAWVEFDGRVLGDEAGIASHFAAFEGLSADHEKQQA